MDLMQLFKEAAVMIEGNNDETTTGLDIGDITNALKGLISNSDGSLNLAALVGGLSRNGLGEIVGSWLGNGENRAISLDQITDLLGTDNIASFASQLGLTDSSAKSALAEVLPEVVDKATSEHSVIDEMMGGSGNPMEMLGKMFG